MNYGPLDLLGATGKDRTYDDLLQHTTVIDLGDAFTLRAINLETLITVKEETAGDKDVPMLPVLRRTLEESRRK